MKASEDIFTRKYLPQYRQLYRLAFALTGNSNEACDIVQDTMVKLWEKRDILSGIASPEAFATTILRNIAIDTIRKRHPSGDINERSIDLSVNPPEDPDSSAFILNAIDSLPPQQQEVIRLSALADKSTNEICQMTGYTPEKVRQLLSRGRRKIKEIYQKFMI